MPPRRSTPQLLHRAWEQRREATPAEQKLWTNLRRLRDQGVHFRRQHAIVPYITDFCAPRRHLVVELDGHSHAERQEQDAERTAYLISRGYRVIRFWNDQVLRHLPSVMDEIQRMLKEL